MPAKGLPDTKVGTFTQALYEAEKKGWIVISMKMTGSRSSRLSNSDRAAMSALGH
jgi:hypothetical protein